MTPTAESVQLKKATYYVEPDQIVDLKVVAARTGRDASEVVRDAIDQFLKSASVRKVLEAAPRK